MSYGKGQRGQAAVETAIVMPLNVFLILSIIQFGLISQARYMAKFAAYRAARVGAMNNADQGKMLAAAQAALLPVLAMPSGAIFGQEVIQPTTDMGSIITKAIRLKINNFIPPGMKMVDVVVCGPLRADVNKITESQLNGVGSSKQVDFDDPRATLDLPAGWSPQTQLKDFLATKLRVQVQLNYRMPIPFANWIISRAYLGMSLPDVMRMSTTGDNLNVFGKYGGSNLWIANQLQIYIAPIFESYALRMQSNYYLGKNQLPTSDLCVSFAKSNPDL